MIPKQTHPLFAGLLILCILHMLAGTCLGEEVAGIERPPAVSSGTSPYVIGLGDILSIYVWKERELSQDATVMPDGRVYLPLAGDFAAEGRTINELKDEIAQGYDKFVTAPEVTVTVKEMRSRRIYIIGKVTRPGPFSLEANMTVLQAISSAGGFTEWADTKNILVVRRGKDRQSLIPFNYKDFVDGKRVDQNILLEPNDTIVVP